MCSGLMRAPEGRVQGCWPSFKRHRGGGVRRSGCCRQLLQLDTEEAAVKLVVAAPALLVHRPEALQARLQALQDVFQVRGQGLPLSAKAPRLDLRGAGGHPRPENPALRCRRPLFLPPPPLQQASPAQVHTLVTRVPALLKVPSPTVARNVGLLAAMTGRPRARLIKFAQHWHQLLTSSEALLRGRWDRQSAGRGGGGGRGWWIWLAL
jgi:hypothetical protein